MLMRSIVQTLKQSIPLLLFAALAAFFLLAWQAQLKNPDYYSTSDFAAFFSAGRIAQTEGTQYIFDLERQLTYQQSISPYVLSHDETNPFVHPPFILPLLWLAVNADYIGSFIRWGLFMLIIQAFAALVLARGLSLQDRTQMLLVTIGMTLFFPAQIAILKGQDTAVLLLGGAIWLLGFRRNDDRLAGLGLALTTIRPHIAIVLALPFLFKRQRIWWSFVAGSTVLVAFSLLLLGYDGTLTFLQTLQVSAGGEGYQINESAMVNLLGLILRFFPDFSPVLARQASWVIYVLCIGILSITWKFSTVISERHLALATVLALLAVPHLHYHDMALLALPLSSIIAEDQSVAKLKRSAAVIFPIGLSVLLWFTFIVSPLYFPFLYILCTFMAGWLWLPVHWRHAAWHRLGLTKVSEK